MNWTELRPLLRIKFGKDFGFYNDLYKSGTRRIKIYTHNPEGIYSYIKGLNLQLDVNYYKETPIFCRIPITRVTIHYR